MGACTFTTTVRTTAKPRDAFQQIKREIIDEAGSDGYNGTLAMKDSFVMIQCDHQGNIDYVWDFIENLINNEDKRIDDKYGPAGCIRFDSETLIFFGWAAE